MAGVKSQQKHRNLELKTYRSGKDIRPDDHKNHGLKDLQRPIPPGKESVSVVLWLVMSQCQFGSVLRKIIHVTS